MAEHVNEFRVNDRFSEKVLGITDFNGRLFVAREDGVFVSEDGRVFRRLEIARDVEDTKPPHKPRHKPTMYRPPSSDWGM